MKSFSKYRSSGGRNGYPPIVIDPEKFDGEPFILDTVVTVRSILDKIEEGLSDKKICRIFNKHAQDTHRKLTPKLVDTCRAWQAWAEPETLKDTFSRINGQSMIMLDENISYKLLTGIVPLFGRSSHVHFEGLIGEDNDDEADIWQFVEKNNFKLVLTCDKDFQDITSRFKSRNCPAVLYISPELRELADPPLLEPNFKTVNEQILHYLKTNQARIFEFMNNKNALHAVLTKKGLQDETFVGKPSNDNKSSSAMRYVSSL